ncbi:alpha/beta hydrolase [Roseomonas sp. GC11]|uniref:alpha/beta hydrolase n=1 Tax=Roseomonas sp. GC11 TaxID=2950546 RepID=UPI00210A50DB|nr:alpha/beta hydrolase [Roseomonas sp. GC11]MCQ4158710.1 alpha/beta hydrolase [Roseomonas sp. GC11]
MTLFRPAWSRRATLEAAALALARPAAADDGAARLAAGLSAPGRAAIPLDDVAGALTLYSYRAAAYRPGGRVVVVLHGMNRNGDAYRDFWVEAAERHGLLVLAPCFSSAAYPGAAAYNNGHLRDAAGQLRPAAAWSYAVPARLLALLRQAGVVDGAPAWLFGHSAGGQFAHRLASTQDLTPFRAIAAANPGWYSLPRLDLPFPAGLGGIGLDEAALARLLAFPLLILAGEQDRQSASPSLPRHDAALAQGPNRFSRAQTYLEAGRAEAARRGLPFGWSLIPVPHIGHDGAAMSRVAASLWFEGRLPAEDLLRGWGHAGQRP